MKWIRNQFKTVYLQEMMDKNGGFPAELARTKPYGYSLFVIDAMAGVAQIASRPDDDLWLYELPDGRSMRRGMEFIFPYIQDKSKWPKQQDVMHWEDWPVRQPSLLFAGLKFNKPEYLATWRKLKSDPEVFEVLRNLPLRHPLLWVGQPAPGNSSRPSARPEAQRAPDYAEDMTIHVGIPGGGIVGETRARGRFGRDLTCDS